ncbi:MAG: hypothetical protein CVT88_07365 [Candidatus Altiarchaeales archaeon HGW-Altiarchaeales-1]|nr:MAG: hypothetical protein CVT89_06360 [Candidatus Altiarchaeales archaeon HGW-Altiarchaeales-2]PKP58388.1 MAG: hypothetical protein CVT88_07365 [Candidatus Altiarchaeales archaeon HGW-Altiarchaeales-1]
MTINKNTLFALIATGVMVGALVMTGANPSNGSCDPCGKCGSATCEYWPGSGACFGYGYVGTGCIGDVNNDKKINHEDLVLLQQAYGSHKGDPKYNQNPRADLNCDGKVDIRDLVLLAKNFGKTCCP